MRLDLPFLRKSVGGFAAHVHQLRREIEAKRREREDIAAAPVAKQDLLQMMESWVADTRAAYLAKMSNSLSSAFGRNPERCFDAAFVANRMSTVGASGVLGGLMGELRNVDGVLCAFFGDQMLAGLRQAVEAASWPVGGLPLRQRVARLGQLEREIEALVEQEKSLTAEAAAMGVRIDAVTPAEARAMRGGKGGAAEQITALQTAAAPAEQDPAGAGETATAAQAAADADLASEIAKLSASPK